MQAAYDTAINKKLTITVKKVSVLFGFSINRRTFFLTGMQVNNSTRVNIGTMRKSDTITINT